MPWKYEPNDPEILGFASLSDLVDRPVGDLQLKQHLILPDGVVGDPGWLGQDIRNIMPFLNRNYRVIIDNLNNPNKVIDASDVFFAEFGLTNSTIDALDLSQSVSGKSNYLSNCNANVVTMSHFVIPDSSIPLEKNFSGISFQNCTIKTLSFHGCQISHINLSDCTVEVNLEVLRCPLEYLNLEQNTRINGLNLPGIPADCLFADFKRVAVNPQPFKETYPLAISHAVEKLQKNW